MTWMLLAAIFLPTSRHNWIGAEEPNLPPNVLLICVDDLRPELKCFGKEYIDSPNIDRLANKGVRFSRHYVQAPTCGASRFALLMGHYGGADNGAIFRRARELKSGKSIAPSMPAWFKQNGYETVSVGKVSHHPGGQGGPDWNDPAQLEMPNSWTLSIAPSGKWKHPRGWMHGLANGEIRKKAGQMDVFQAVEGPDSLYPDGHSIEDGIDQLKRITSTPGKPFLLAVGILRPHLPFGAPERYLAPYADKKLPEIPHANKPNGKTTWHRSGEFMKYNRWGKNPNVDEEFALQVRRHYAACVTFADSLVGRLLNELESSDAANNTIVVLWGDHGWHLGEHAVWGKHTLFEESLLSPLIIHVPNELKGIAKAGYSCNSVVETVDIFPTLCDLSGLETPESCAGVSLVDVSNPNHPRSSKDELGAIGYKGKTRTIRTDRYRMIEHSDGYIELYDHDSAELETKNIAETQKNVVDDLRAKLRARMSK